MDMECSEALQGSRNLASLLSRLRPDLRYISEMFNGTLDYLEREINEGLSDERKEKVLDCLSGLSAEMLGLIKASPLRTPGRLS